MHVLVSYRCTCCALYSTCVARSRVTRTYYIMIRLWTLLICGKIKAIPCSKTDYVVGRYPTPPHPIQPPHQILQILEESVIIQYMCSSLHTQQIDMLVDWSWLQILHYTMNITCHVQYKQVVFILYSLMWNSGYVTWHCIDTHRHQRACIHVYACGECVKMVQKRGMIMSVWIVYDRVHCICTYNIYNRDTQ